MIQRIPEYPPSVIGVGGRGCGGGGAGGLAAGLAGGLGLPRRPPQPLPSPAPALLSPSPAQPQCCGHWPGPQPAGRAARAPMGPKVLQGALWSKKFTVFKMTKSSSTQPLPRAHLLGPKVVKLLQNAF